MVLEGILATLDNIKAAFASESKAYIKYMAYSTIAEKDGRIQAARLFRALAEAERVHAMNHLLIIGELGNTEHNISNAIDNETYEFTQMYPSFIVQAEKEGDHRALINFKRVLDAERGHSTILANLLDRLGNEKEISYSVCSVCGHVISGNIPEKCPACNVSKDKIRQTD
jgi:rubrerythrin